MAVSKKRKPKKSNSPIVIRQSDVKRLHREVVREAAVLSMAVFFTVLRDKEGYGSKRLSRMMANVDKLMEEVDEGRVNIYDLKKSLEEENRIFFV